MKLWVTLLLSVLLLISTQARQPNIVFVLADDLGWAELGCYGNTYNETPHLDQLAKEGLRFTHAYAAAPVCSPYRAALLTGQHPARLNILDYLRPNSSNALPTNHITLPKILQRNGYKTGMVGKWHLTGYKHHDAEFEVRPTDHGFDFNIGSEVKGVGNGANFFPYVFRTQPIPWIDLPRNRLGKGEYLTDRLNLEAVEFIERNKERPFFLYLSHYAPHTILNGRPDLVEKYRKKHKTGSSTRKNCYLCKDNGLPVESCTHWAEHHNPHLAAMLESIDDGIGLIDKKLKELGLSQDTILIFSSDNGGETNVTSNAPLRGGKSQLYEGGIRVPLVIRWPNGNLTGGKTISHPTANYDFYPTLLDAANLDPNPKQTFDGVSVLDSWKKPENKPCPRTLFWHYPLDRPHFLGGVSSGAIRDGDWKLIEYFDPSRKERYELFDLAKDPSENQDIASTEPNQVKKLAVKLASWRVQTGARIPSRPLLTEPRNLQFGEHFSSGQVSENWFFQKEWHTENGVLFRNDFPGENKRLFYKNPNFKDALIRFDFRLDGATNIRLVTGSSGDYNSVIHIHPDHFYIQTAMDDRGPWYSMRHGECAYKFQPGKWYTMTVEYLKDELVAHLDHQHLAYAKHPIIDQERTYFALQVDQASAAFDNIQVFQAGSHKNRTEILQYIQSVANQHPVEKSSKEQFDILKRNTHAKLHLTDPKYRQLVQTIDDLDEQKRQKFPEAFQSIKVIKKAIQDERKKLLKEDPKYKETLHATHRANRALDQYLHDQDPSIQQLPHSKQKAALEKARKKHLKEPAYLKLLKVAETAQQNLETRYPQLFVPDETLRDKQNIARKSLKQNPAYQTLIKTRAKAYQTKEKYLESKNPDLPRLQALLDQKKK